MNRNNQNIRRQTRIRGKIKKLAGKPRLTIFRSNKYMYAQIVDDKTKKTLIGVSEKKVVSEKGSKIERAKLLGQEIAKVAKEKKIREVVFDKGSYAFHGRVKALADGAREGGLIF